MDNEANLFSFFIVPGALAVQQFIEGPSYVEVNPGSNVLLTCRVDNIGGECRWQKDGKVRPREQPG